MKPNKLLAPAILQAASAVNAKGLGLEIYKQYVKYFGKQTWQFVRNFFFINMLYINYSHTVYCKAWLLRFIKVTQK